MSSHREAPETSKDPVADSTDVYAFVSPDQPGTVTLIANYIPLQGPAGGTHFHEFGGQGLSELSIDKSADGDAALPCARYNTGPLSTPNSTSLASTAVHKLPGGIQVFAGQRAEGFYVDLGSIFDLANLRPVEQVHAQHRLNVFSGPAPGVNATAALNVHSIAIQVPISQLTRSGAGSESSQASVIGVWTTASRQSVRLWDSDNGENVSSGPYRQVSRLGNPLGNRGPRP